MGAPDVSATIAANYEHERLELFHDPDSGLTGAVAIHSTALGPAMGGLRLRRYPSLEDAAVDALRLARAMTYKNASAGLALGGGKAVLVDDGQWGTRRDDRLRAFGAVLERLDGRYITAEDVGTTPEDMDLLATLTPWVAGRSVSSGGRGDPSHATARTVFAAVRSAVALHLHGARLSEVRVGVLGAGHVGSHLVAMLLDAGARVVVADIDPTRTARWEQDPRVAVVAVDGFLRRDVDVLAPCAFGELIGEREATEVKCAVVAGAANNPLVGDHVAELLHNRGVLYVPDFLANCGGIVHVGAEALDLPETEVAQLLMAAQLRVTDVLENARDTRRLPLTVATDAVEALLRAHRRMSATAVAS